MSTDFERLVASLKGSQHQKLKNTVSRMAVKYRVPNSIKESLPSWVQQLKNRRTALTDELLLTLLTEAMKSISKHGISELSDTAGFDSTSLQNGTIKSSLRFAIRIATRDCDLTTHKQLLEALKQPVTQWYTELRQINQACIDRHKKRMRACVKGLDHSQDIASFLGYLSQVFQYRQVPIQFHATPLHTSHKSLGDTSRREINAHTDGSAIYLPSHLASTPDQQLNEFFLVAYLTAHEYLHLAAGSFDFSFKSMRGKRIFRSLRPLRNNFKARNAAGRLSRELHDKLLKDGFNVEVVQSQPMPDIAKFCSHFPNSQLAHSLLNALEDGRLEDLIKRRLPGLSAINRAHNALYHQEVVPSSMNYSSITNLVNAIGMYAAQRPVDARLKAVHADCFEEAKKIVDKLRNKQLKSVYDSAIATRKLYLLLEASIEKQALTDVRLSVSMMPLFDIEEIAVRKKIAESGETSNLRESGGRQYKDNPDYAVEEPGIWLPEWSDHQLVQRSTHVRLNDFEAGQTYPLLPSIQQPVPDLRLIRNSMTNGHDRHWHSNGAYLATERFAEYRASRRSGVDGFPVAFDLRQKSPSMKWTLLFDLSISMETPRYGLESETPIQRAIQYGVWLAAGLEAQGVEVEAYGAVSGGKKLCQLYRLPTPVSKSIPLLRCRGAGGFRIGALIRSIAGAYPELAMRPFQGDHRLSVFTDGDPTYVALRAEHLFERLHRDNCGPCTSRHRCKIEHAINGVEARGQEFDLFESLRYGLADTGHAMRETRQLIQTDLCLCGPPVNEEVFNQFIGEERWINLSVTNVLSLLEKQSF